ncbi:MAG TPA: Bcr/CflA family multidrug efflux MFS transporter [Pseudonocardiaceae bacterium]|nr:Bcr/CflA family multidrug efflux MFS transporter [Pseudonocardiaceae bacterium]
MTDPIAPAEPTAGPSRAETVRLVLILGSLSSFGPLSIDMYLPAFPSIAGDLHAGPSAVQLTLTACLVGLAVGQLVTGPLSDTLGRKRPLMVGLVLYVLLSVGCALAPSVGALIGFRFLQALGGGAGLVIANAAARDRFSGTAMARFLSLLMLVNGIAPIVAPVIGGQLLRFTSWRGVFWLLAAIGLLLVAVCGLWLAESLPPERRVPGRLPDTLRSYGSLLSTRLFLGYTLAAGCSFAAMFAYISGSSFVLQDIFGLSAQQFSLVFAVNALGIVTAGQLNGRVVGRFGPRRLLAVGLASATVGGIGLLLAVLLGWGLPAVLIGLFLVVSSIGLVSPNGVALAMADYPSMAGTAAALLGMAQTVIGGVVAPLVGLGGTATAVPMAVVISVLTVAGFAVFVLLTRISPN